MDIEEYLENSGYGIGLEIVADAMERRRKLLEVLPTVAEEHRAEGERLLADVEQTLCTAREQLALQRAEAEALFGIQHSRDN